MEVPTSPIIINSFFEINWTQHGYSGQFLCVSTVYNISISNVINWKYRYHLCLICRPLLYLLRRIFFYWDYWEATDWCCFLFWSYKKYKQFLNL